MPTITINGKACEFERGQMILQVAQANEIEIPHYCYHPKLSIVASCRICLAEVWAPNPRNDNKLEPIPKLLPTCQTPAGEGQFVYTDSPKAVQNQKAVMEYLLLNHPIDCPVCDQAGECLLQDYSYQYGRSAVRFQEEKITQPKKDVGPNILLYSDRCILCTRCVRFCREITGTNELLVEDRGAMGQIDVFPGKALDNPIASNVIDLCPVGALLDKKFLFEQRVWFLTKTPSIDGITCSGDNIFIEHNKGQVYRIKPRLNPEVNGHWITDEVRYGWDFVHDERRLTRPGVRGEDAFDMTEAPLAYELAYEKTNAAFGKAKKIAISVSPMLSCEDAYLLASYVTGFGVDVVWGVGPVPRVGDDQAFLDGYTMYAEKAPNARGVRRVLGTFGTVLEHDAFVHELARDQGIDTVLVTGNYPGAWITPDFLSAIGEAGGRFLVLIDTLPGGLDQRADVQLPGATWAEKAGTFENVKGLLQAFSRAIAPIDYCKSEAQLALDLIAKRDGLEPETYDAAQVRATMMDERGLREFEADIRLPIDEEQQVESDMHFVEL